MNDHQEQVFEQVQSDLCSEDKDIVVRAVDSLCEKIEGGPEEVALLDILNDWQEDETSAPLWAMIALGHIGSLRAVPTLLKILDSDMDYWVEAAAEALNKIAIKHGDVVLGMMEQFVLDRLDNDPFHSRIFGYSPFAVMTKSERAKRFLIRMLETDTELTSSIAHDLVPFGDRSVLPILRRAIELARRTENHFDGRELRDAYCLLDGAYRNDWPELWREPWQKRWSRQLDYLGKDEEEMERLDEDMFRPSSDKDEKALKLDEESQREIQIRDSHQLADFDIHAYLAVRERGDIEEEFAAALRFCGLDDIWNVESVQAMMNQMETPGEALERLQADFVSSGSFEEFTKRLFELWNVTPRESEQGLSPEDMLDLASATEHNRRFNRRVDDYIKRAKSEVKVGRNDPCPCGSGKKYKKCCGA